MPRMCFDCDTNFDDSLLYWDHMTTCEQPGCGEEYCPANSVCTYCMGNGFHDDYDEYDSRTGIYSYDYKPEPIWFGGRRADYYVGFELEISANQYDTTPIMQWCEDNGHTDMLYCKEDGSVDGFEIVSHPMTPDYFNAVNWDGFFGMLGENWPTRYGDEPVGHGLHVHVSRTAFPYQSTLARWSYLLNRYQEHTERVARRNSSQWARFTPHPVSLCLPYIRQGGRSGHWYEDGPALPCGCCNSRILVEDRTPRLTRQFQSIGYPERYQAVNLTNENTVEVRVFKSTRKPDEFVSSLHFVMATVDFVRTMQPWHATRTSVAWDTFAEFVRSHPVFAKESAILTGSIEPVLIPTV